jgi:hypothetical protein
MDMPKAESLKIIAQEKRANLSETLENWITESNIPKIMWDAANKGLFSVSYSLLDFPTDLRDFIQPYFLKRGYSITVDEEDDTIFTVSWNS